MISFRFTLFYMRPQKPSPRSFTKRNHDRIDGVELGTTASRYGRGVDLERLPHERHNICVTVHIDPLRKLVKRPPSQRVGSPEFARCTRKQVQENSAVGHGSSCGLTRLNVARFEKHELTQGTYGSVPCATRTRREESLSTSAVVHKNEHGICAVLQQTEREHEGKSQTKTRGSVDNMR